MARRFTSVRAPRSGVVVVMASTTLLLVARGAGATPPDAVQLAWVRGEGAEACADAAGIAREVTRRLGRDPFAADAAHRIDGVVSREHDQWVARIWFRDVEGAPGSSREVRSDAPACDALTVSAGVAVALGIDPDAPTAVPAQRPIEPVVVRAPATRAVRPRAQGLVRPHGGGVTVRAAGLFGVLPTPDIAGELAVDGLIDGAFRFNAGAFVPADVAGPSSESAGVFSLFGGWLELCGEIWPHSRIALSGCLGGVAGAVARSGPSSSRQVWAGPLAEVRGTFPIVGPLVAEVGVQGVVSIAQPTFVESMTMGPMGRVVFQSSRAVALAWVGLGVHF